MGQRLSMEKYNTTVDIKVDDDIKLGYSRFWYSFLVRFQKLNKPVRNWLYFPKRRPFNLSLSLIDS